MAYVALPPETRVSREASARSHWAVVRAARPDLEPAILLQERLVLLVVGLTETLEHGWLPRLSLPPRYVAAKLRKGIPAMAAEPIPMPTAVLTPTLLALCEALAQGGAGDAARHIKEAISSGTMEAGSLLSASLARDQHAIRTGGVHRGLAPDLLWLVSELAVSPFVHALQQVLVAPDVQADGHDAVRSALDTWAHGYCPICGSWPALVEHWCESRVLRCSFCALAWSLATEACAYCGEGGATFVTSSPARDRPDRRLETCGSCRSYLKAIDVDQPAPFPLLAIADLETMDVDISAMQAGFQRPPLRTFALGALRK
jgi:FdhE protein